MDHHNVPACLQIGGAGNTSSAPSTAPASRSATPPTAGHSLQHITPATSVHDEEAPAQQQRAPRNPYLSSNLERSINSWLDGMLEARCLPFNPHADGPFGWEGLEPYSADTDEGLHGWTDLSGQNIKAGMGSMMGLGQKRKQADTDMGDIPIGLSSSSAAAAAVASSSSSSSAMDIVAPKDRREVQRGYQEWMETVSKDGAYSFAARK